MKRKSLFVIRINVLLAGMKHTRNVVCYHFTILPIDIRYSHEELLGFYTKAPIAPCLEGKANVII